MFNINKIRSVGCLRNYNLNRYFGNSNFRNYQTVTNHRTGCGIYYNTLNMASKMSTSVSTPHSSQHSNRLAYEKSPYLLQHATNPVDWYPWGDEAIQKARDENKLIFLSVGYSTCHWCHVMEKESFENEDVAKLMNENYINIKVDREERPDIDKIYMTFVLMINGSGGWPMSVWLTPDLAPVTAGTYFPPQDRWGMPGFQSVLTKVADKWKQNGPELTRTGKTVISALQKNINERDKDGEVLTIEGKFKQAVTMYKRNFDDEWGGWGRQPKFPEVSKLNFLLHAHFKKPKDTIANMVLITLNKIANGGIHDHVFGGFSRYSVDQRWHVPHFEKMLYDQGQLLSAYTNAYRLTKKSFYLDISKNIVKYLCKDLQHPKGGFYSGEDADSLPTHVDTVKIEGAFYAWTFSEIRNAFEKNKQEFENVGTNKVSPFKIYCHHYDIRNDGNVEPSSDPHGHLLAKNILFVKESVEETAKTFKIEKNQVSEILRIGNEILYEIRCKRPRPHLDTKIICAWNGLVLGGLSKLACISDTEEREKYLKIAKNLVDFIKEHLYNADSKTLLRSCYGEGIELDGTSNVSQPIQGFLDDYAFLIKGLLDYYVATLDVEVLHWAMELQKTQDELFWDEKDGGYFYSQANSPNVIVRLKEDHDGAEPCGNSMSIHNLMLLNTYFEEGHFKDKVKTMLSFFESTNPFGYVLPHMLSGLLLYDYGIQMMVVVGPDNDDAKKLFSVARDFFIPGLVPIQIKIDRLHELTRKSAVQFKMIRDKPTVYICHNQVCQLPITDPNELRNTFNEKFIYNCDI